MLDDDRREAPAYQQSHLPKCALCGAEFAPGKRPQVYCSAACRIRRSLDRETAKRALAGTTTIGGRVSCKRCGAEFAKVHKRQFYCGPECAAAVEREAARLAAERKSRLAGRVKIGSAVACAECGGTFQVWSERNIYCRACSEIAERGGLPAQREWKNEWERKKRLTDPKYALNQRISGAIASSLKGTKAGWHWETLVGYTINDLMRHLERQFTSKMSWANRGSYWEIDHILPLAMHDFDAPDHPEFKAAWALLNLRPLPKSVNREKRDKRTHLL